jgi:hypothetical protein
LENQAIIKIRARETRVDPYFAKKVTPDGMLQGKKF